MIMKVGRPSASSESLGSCGEGVGWMSVCLEITQIRSGEAKRACLNASTDSVTS